jgi:hypothetical protein
MDWLTPIDRCSPECQKKTPRQRAKRKQHNSFLVRQNLDTHRDSGQSHFALLLLLFLLFLSFLMSASFTEIPPNIYNWPHDTSSEFNPSSNCLGSSTSFSNMTLSNNFTNSKGKKSEEMNEIWRTIDNYCLYGVENKKKKRKSIENLEFKEMVSLYIDKNNSKSQTILTGSILPNPSCSSCCPIEINVFIINYAIDFGYSPDDRNRGLWLMSTENIWYKLENPHPSYSDIADECLASCAQYLNFYDSIVYGAKNGKTLINLDQSSGRYDCEYDIKTIYRKSQFHFDINILRSKSKFFFEISLPIFLPSCILMKDLQVGDVIMVP